MARKTSNKNDSLLRSNWSFVRGSGKRMQALLFVLAFGVIGGAGFLAFNSFASTSVSPADLGLCPGRYSSNNALHRGASNNTCVAAAQRYLGALERMDNRYITTCPSSYRPAAHSIGHLSSNSTMIVDGDFGPITEKYVKCYQHYGPNHAGSVDGYIGNNTWLAMLTDCVAHDGGYDYYGLKCRK